VSGFVRSANFAGLSFFRSLDTPTSHADLRSLLEPCTTCPHGVTEIAKAAGMAREALYQALRPDSAPRFDTADIVCIALCVCLVVQPLGVS
jgi:DNA-binding phage protein